VSAVSAVSRRLRRNSCIQIGMDQVLRLGIMEAPMAGVPSPTVQKVLASYWHIGLYAHPRLPELLITGRERDYLAEFIRTFGGMKMSRKD